MLAVGTLEHAGLVVREGGGPRGQSLRREELAGWRRVLGGRIRHTTSHTTHCPAATLKREAPVQ